MVERELTILGRSGSLPVMPPALADAGGAFEIEYDSPLSRAQRSEEGIGVVRTLEMVAPLAAADPSVMDNYNTDEIARLAAQVNGAPQKILRPVEARDAMRRERTEVEAGQVVPALASDVLGAATNAIT